MFFQSLSFGKQLYDVTALQKAAYRSMNALTVEMVIEGDDFLCQLSANIGVDESTFLMAVQEFKKDALDYQLRHRLDNETKPIKNFILGLAFSKAGLGSE